MPKQVAGARCQVFARLQSSLLNARVLVRLQHRLLAALAPRARVHAAVHRGPFLRWVAGGWRAVEGRTYEGAFAALPCGRSRDTLMLQHALISGAR